MIEFIFFIIGILFTVTIMPVLESFTELFQVFLEAQKLKIAVKVAEANKKIKELTKNDN